MKSGSTPTYDLVQQNEQPTPESHHHHHLNPNDPIADRVTLRVALVIAVTACVFSIGTISVIVYYTPS